MVSEGISPAVKWRSVTTASSPDTSRVGRKESIESVIVGVMLMRARRMCRHRPTSIATTLSAFLAKSSASGRASLRRSMTNRHAKRNQQVRTAVELPQGGAPLEHLVASVMYERVVDDLKRSRTMISTATGVIERAFSIARRTGIAHAAIRENSERVVGPGLECAFAVRLLLACPCRRIQVRA